MRAGRQTIAPAPGSPRDLTHGLIVRFARRQQRQFVDGDDADGGRRKAGCRHRDALYDTLVVAHRRDHEPLVVVGAEGGHAVRAEGGLHPLQVDAQAVQLDEAAAAADHLVQPVGRTACDVAGVQGVDHLAQAQVRASCARSPS